MKKATHKKTGLVRAVKVLKKAYLTAEEQEKVINEVEILRSLVSVEHSYDKINCRTIQISARLSKLTKTRNTISS